MIDNLFENAGTKIKNFAKISFIVEVISSVIVALYIIIAEIIPSIRWDDDAILDIFLCLFYMICAAAGAYVLSLLIYGFGCLVENSDSKKKTATKILEKLSEKENTAAISESPSKVKEASVTVNKPESIKKEETKTEPIENNTKAEENKENESPLKKSLKYALKYSTAQGMRSHLTYRTMTIATKEEKELINSILSKNDNELEAEIQNTISNM